MTFLLYYKWEAVSMSIFQVIFTAQWSQTLGRPPARASPLACCGAGSSSTATHAGMWVCKNRKLLGRKMGLGCNFSWYTLRRKRSESEPSLKVSWRHFHQDLVHSELQIFLGPGYLSYQESCLGNQAMSLFDLFLARLMFSWKVEANQMIFSSCLRPLLWLT